MAIAMAVDSAEAENPKLMCNLQVTRRVGVSSFARISSNTRITILKLGTRLVGIRLCVSQ